MLAALRSEKWWLIANAAGIALFLYLASKTWIEPELKGLQVATGGAAVVWAFSALPVMLLFLLVDLVWFGRASYRAVKYNAIAPLAVVFLAGAAWVAAAYFDNIHHGS